MWALALWTERDDSGGGEDVEGEKEKEEASDVAESILGNFNLDHRYSSAYTDFCAVALSALRV